MWEDDFTLFVFHSEPVPGIKVESDTEVTLSQTETPFSPTTFINSILQDESPTANQSPSPPLSLTTRSNGEVRGGHETREQRRRGEEKRGLEEERRVSKEERRRREGQRRR